MFMGFFLPRKAAPVVTPDLPERREDALAYYMPEARAGRGLRRMTSLEQMYAYYLRD